MNNRQEVERAPGDATTVRQSVTPGSRDNLQTAVTAAPDSKSVVVQSTDGSGNVQSVDQSGRGNVAVQTQSGHGNHQVIRQSGGSNLAVQSQSGAGLKASLHQRGGETDVQSQQ
jgi:hypothetical protein